MDPKANLDEQLRLARQIQEAYDRDDDEDIPNYLASRLAELVLALDEWQRKGGFSPYAKTKASA